MITFFKDKKVESRAKVEPATGQYIGPYRTGLDAVGQVAYRQIGVVPYEVGAGSTDNVLQFPGGHLLKVGDVLQFTTGASVTGDFVFVQSTTTNTVTLSQTASSNLSGLFFYAYRPTFLVTDSSNYLLTALSPTQVYPFSINESYDGSLGEVIKTGLWNGTDWKAWGGEVNGTLGVQAPSSAGGNAFRFLDVNNTASTVKSTGGSLFSFTAFNATGAVLYLKLYNVVTPSAASTPIQTYPLEAGKNFPPDLGYGIQMNTAISFRCTTGMADADNVSPAANGCILNGTYY